MYLIFCMHSHTSRSAQISTGETGKTFILHPVSVAKVGIELWAIISEVEWSHNSATAHISWACERAEVSQYCAHFAPLCAGLDTVQS